MKRFTTAVLAATIAAAALPAFASDNLRIAYIDPLSGTFGATGNHGLKQVLFAADEINKAGGINGETVEIVSFDNKINPKESLVQLQKAIDRGIRYVMQGNGSSVASALIDAVDKHNERNPGDEVLFINYSAVDPALTNEACSFWHFRFDSHAGMKMEAVTDWIVAKGDIDSVYVLGQDYSHGQAVAAAAVSQLAVKAPAIAIAGNELHPLGKVKDFTPYVQKIISSGADAIITGNWGSDLVLLVKAATDSGWDKPILTYYGSSLGSATAMGENAVGKVRQVSEIDVNFASGDAAQEARIDAFDAQYGPDEFYAYHRIFNALTFLDLAAEKAGSLDPKDVAFALEGLVYEGPYGPVTMRAEDHQVLQDLFITTFAKDPARGVEGLPLGWAMEDEKVDRVAASNTASATTCEMTRPAN